MLEPRSYTSYSAGARAVSLQTLNVRFLEGCRGLVYFSLGRVLRFCRSGNLKAAVRRFLYACVRFGIHSGLERTVESTAALADLQTLPRTTCDSAIPKGIRRRPFTSSRAPCEGGAGLVRA